MTFNLVRLPLPWSMCIKWPFPTLTKASAWKTWKALLFFLSPNSHYTCIFNHTHPSPPFLLVACNTVYTVVKCNGHQCFCLLNRKKKLTVLFPCCFLPPLVVFVQNKYTGGLCIFLQTQIYTCYIQTAVKLFLFTLPPSFPLDIFARCHLWNTVATQRDVS